MAASPQQRQFNRIRHAIGATWQIRLKLCFIGPTRVHKWNGKSIGSAILPQLMAQSSYTYNEHPFAPKLPLPMEGSEGHPSPQPKQHLNQFSRICTDDCRVSIYFTMGRLFPPPLKIAHSHGDLESHLGPPQSSTQMASPSVQLFCRAH